MDESEQSRKFFLGGLNYNTTEDGLKGYFGNFGKLVDVVVMRFPDSKRSRGFGFITFSSSDEAEACFQSCPHTLDETVLDIKRATPRDQDRNRDGPSHSGSSGPKGEVLCKIFVGGLSYDTTDESLKTYFEQFGEITDSIVMKYKDTGRSRGFGFVTYSTVECVDEVQGNRPHTLDGAQVETKRATPREESAPRGGESGGKSVKKVFVGGIKEDIDDKDLEDYFSTFGTVIKIEQMVDKATGRKRGFGFVEFDDYDPVDKLAQQSRHQINGRRIDIKKAVGRDVIQEGGGGRGGFGGGRGGGPSPWGGNSFGGGGGGGGGSGGGFRGNSSFGNSGGGGGGGGSWGNNQGGGGGGGGVGSFNNPWQNGDTAQSVWGGNQQQQQQQQQQQSNNGWSNGGSSGYMTANSGWGGGYSSGNGGANSSGNGGGYSSGNGGGYSSGNGGGYSSGNVGGYSSGNGGGYSSGNSGGGGGGGYSTGNSGGAIRSNMGGGNRSAPYSVGGRGGGAPGGRFNGGGGGGGGGGW